VEVRILGINEAGHESGNGSICGGRDLPWLQQVAGGDDAWSDVTWDAEYRDVILVDPTNERREAYNLTTYNLATAANREELKAKLRALAVR
jgi:hypothetical protein